MTRGRRAARLVQSLSVVIVSALAGTCVAVTPAPGRAAADPTFDFAGVIEGAYGTPWTHAERTSMLKWMAARGLDTYIHAPKDDPYARAQWRDPYPAAEMKQYVEEVRLAANLGVDWIPSTSPGFPLIPSTAGATTSLDFCFSCPADLATLKAKLMPFFKAGARSLMVSFDDVQKISTHPEDLAAYGSGDAAYGQMNRDLLNQLQRDFQAKAGDRPFHLVTVLADYTGAGNTEYLGGVRSGGGLDPGIRVLWTGNQALSRTITAADSRAYASWAGVRRVGIWDNYPANDFTGGIAGYPLRLFLGPYRGRSADLATSTSGIVMNGMNPAWANRIVLGTVAEYAANPADYRPERAWNRTLRVLGHHNPGATATLRAFAANSRSSALNRSESLEFVRLRDRLLAGVDSGKWRKPAAELDAYLVQLLRASRRLETVAPELVAGAPLFVQQLRLEAQVGRAAVAVLVGDASSKPSSLAQLLALQAQSLATPAYMFGDRVTPSLSNPTTIAEVFVASNVMDEFVSSVLARMGSG